MLNDEVINLLVRPFYLWKKIQDGIVENIDDDAMMASSKLDELKALIEK